MTAVSFKDNSIGLVFRGLFWGCQWSHLRGGIIFTEVSCTLTLPALHVGCVLFKLKLHGIETFFLCYTHINHHAATDCQKPLLLHLILSFSHRMCYCHSQCFLLTCNRHFLMRRFWINRTRNQISSDCKCNLTDRKKTGPIFIWYLLNVILLIHARLSMANQKLCLDSPLTKEKERRDLCRVWYSYLLTFWAFQSKTNQFSI